MTTNPVRDLRAKLLLSACAVLVPGVAAAQTINTPTTATVNVDATDVVTVTSAGSIVATGVRGINFNAAPTGAGPNIDNSGRIETTNAAGYGIDTQGTFSGRSITINNLTAGSIIKGLEGGIRIRNGAGSDTSIGASTLITVNNFGTIQGGSGGGINLGSLPNARFIITNQTGGSISGATGIFVAQGTLTNSGTITGTAGWGVDTQGTGTGRAITINNLAGTISGSEGGIRIRNGAGQETAGVTTANLVTITNAAMIQGGTEFGINLVGIPNTQGVITNQSTGIIRGSAGIIAATATIDNYGLITGTETSQSGTGEFPYLISNGEAIRLNGIPVIVGGTIVDYTGTSLITLRTGSTTTGTGDGANAIHVSQGSQTTVSVESGATVNGDISIDADIGIVNIDSGAVLNGNIDTDPGQLTVNLQTGATVTGQIGGHAAAAGIFDTLNLSGTGSATVPVLVAFDRINVLSGDWTLTSTAFATTQGVQIANGATVRYGNGTTGGAFSGAVENEGAIIFNRTDTLAPGSSISGTGTIEITGTGTLALQVANTYIGATTITDGRLRADFANVFAPGSAVIIGANGTLDPNDTAQTVANISGVGRITTGTVTGGILTTGAGAGNTTYGGVVTGLGGIAKTGSGTLTLSGVNTATGTFTVDGGTMLVSGSLAGGASALSGGTLSITGSVAGDISAAGGIASATGTVGGGASVAAGGLLTGNGTIGGAVSVADGTLAAGNGGVGMLTTGSLALSGASVLAYELGTPGTPGASDKITVNGDLTLDGTLTVSDVGGFGYGVYRLIDYTGALTDNGLDIGAVPAGTDTGLLTVQTLIGQQVNLVYGSSAVSPIQFWDGGDTAPDGVIDGGSGSWTNAATNWTSSDGTGNAAWGSNFAVFQGAAGTVTVDDAIGFGGMQFITDGYTVAAGTGTLSAVETLTNLRADPGVTATIAAAIGGTGGIVKNDAGTIILSGANSYGGATAINGGTLRLAGASAIPVTSAVTVAAAGTLDVAANQAIGSLAGDGAVTLSGGSLTAGGLGTSTSFAGVISGAGGFTKAGAGTMTLSGANNYGGATSVTGGTLLLTSTGNISGGALDVSSGAILNLAGVATSVGTLTGAGRVTIGTDGSFTTTSNVDSAYTGLLTGTRASVTKEGTGTLTLSGANTYSGGTTINGGTVVVANATALSDSGGVRVNAGGTFAIQADKTIGALSGAGAVQLGANRLTTSSAQNVEYSGVAAGSGGLAKAGSGTLILSGANTYGGSTDVTGDTLLLTGSVAGAASVASGATLTGTGAIAGTLSVADGATLMPGNAGVGTLTTGGLALSGGSVLAFDLGAPGVAGVSDRIQINGSLVLDGSLNASDAGGFGTGVYRLIDYTGALTDNGLSVGTLPAGFVAGQTQVQTSAVGQVNLVVGAALPDIQFWDGPNTTSNNAVDGGSGSWTNTPTAWTNAAGDFNYGWGSRFAVFQGAAGTVTVDDSIAFTGMQFMTDGYTIAAGTGTLSISEAATNIRVDPGVTATIGAAIGGAGGLVKLDTGTLILSGANNYAGETTINGGTLRVTTASALPGTTAVNVASGATLDLAASQTVGSLAGAGAVTLSGGSLTTGGSNASTTFDGVLSGAGGLTKAGTGTMTLSGANSYTGATAVNGGTLALTGTGRIGGGDLAVSAGATLDLGGNSSTIAGLSGDGTIALGAGTLTAGGAADTSFGGAINGAGGFTKAGAGNLTLTGTNGYAGTTAINAGTLTLGTAGAISDTGAVTVASGATLALGVNKTIGSLDGAGNVALAARTLTVGSGNFSGVASGTGGLTKAGAGTLTLGGVNTYTGATTISGGTLAIGATGSIAASSGVNLTAADATLDVQAGAQTIGGLTGVAGSKVLLGNSTLTAGGTASTSFAGIISGAGGFTKAGSGTLTLSGANTYTGATTVTAGILRSGATNAFGPGALTVQTGARADLAGFAQAVASISGGGAITLGAATLTTGNSTSSEFAGVISGTGGLTKTGSGALILSGASTYTGATNVSAGLLTVNGSIASAVTLGSGGRLGGNGTIGALNISGTVAPGNSIGTLHVNGAVNFAAGSIYSVETNAAGASDQIIATGAVTIAGGTVNVLAGAVAGYAPLTDYTILTGSSVTGTFANVTSDLAFLAPSLFYAPTTVTLRLQRNDVTFAAIGTSPNQKAVGAALERIQSGVLFNTVLAFDAPTARAAFDNLSGEIHADIATQVNRGTQNDARQLLDRLATTSGDGASIWLEGVASRGDVNADAGYDDVGSSRTGIGGGIDYGFGGARIGVTAGYSRDSIELDARGSTGRIGTTHAAVYAGYSVGSIRLRAGGGYAHHDVDTNRGFFAGTFSDALHAEYKGDTTHAFGEAGYAIGAGVLSVEPFAGIAWASTKLNGAAEQGGAAALAFGETKLDSTVATFGLRAGGEVFGGGARLDAEVAGRNYIDGERGTRDMQIVSTGQSFRVTGADFGKTGVITRLGISLPVAGGQIGLGFTGDFSKQSRNYGARLSAGWRF